MNKDSLKIFLIECGITQCQGYCLKMQTQVLDWRVDALKQMGEEFFLERHSDGQCALGTK